MAMTEFVRQDIVKGAHFFQGNIDGEDIDSGTIHVEQPMNADRGTAAGYRTVGFKCKSGELPKSLIATAKSWPITAEITYALDVSGKGQNLIIVAIRELRPAMPQPTAQPK